MKGRHRIHAAILIDKFCGVDVITRDSVFYEDLKMVEALIQLANYIPISGFRSLIKEFPWLKRCFQWNRFEENKTKTMSWDSPYYGLKKLPEIRKKLKLVEPIVAKLIVAGVL